ncbi:MAG: methyltransferase domain-containing protein [Elusimicrobiales bacterium]|nr:methyltransferase domain-containing protein [Elusimicrobiales bacterium]
MPPADKNWSEYYRGMAPEDYSRPTLLKFLLGRRITDTVSRATAEIIGKSVLELGCGTGKFTAMLAQKNRVTALDANSHLFRLKGIPFVAGSALELETLLPSEARFDIIASFFMTDYLGPEEIAKVLRGCRRFLAPDGRLFFTFIADGLWGNIYVNGSRFLKRTAKYNYSLAEIEIISARTGFEIESATFITRFGARFAVLISLKGNKNA